MEVLPKLPRPVLITFARGVGQSIEGSMAAASWRPSTTSEVSQSCHGVLPWLPVWRFELNFVHIFHAIGLVELLDSVEIGHFSPVRGTLGGEAARRVKLHHIRLPFGQILRAPGLPFFGASICHIRKINSLSFPAQVLHTCPCHTL